MCHSLMIVSYQFFHTLTMPEQIHIKDNTTSDSIK